MSKRNGIEQMVPQPEADVNVKRAVWLSVTFTRTNNNSKKLEEAKRDLFSKKKKKKPALTCLVLQNRSSEATKHYFHKAHPF